MILTYTKTNYEGHISCCFDFEPDNVDEYTALANFIYNDYFIDLKFDKAQKAMIIEALYNFVSDSGNKTIEELEKYYFDELKDWFEQAAFNSIGE